MFLLHCHYEVGKHFAVYANGVVMQINHVWLPMTDVEPENPCIATTLKVAAGLGFAYRLTVSPNLPETSRHILFQPTTLSRVIQLHDFACN